jgi:hypothetical protein
MLEVLTTMNDAMTHGVNISDALNLFWSFRRACPALNKLNGRTRVS